MVCFLIKGPNSLRLSVALSPPCSSAWLYPILIKTRCEVLSFLSFDTSLFISRTWAQGRTRGKEGQSFCFQRTAGNFDGKFLHGKRQGPDPAHLRVLWWNNSKCLSCIVWHAAGGALKPLLPAPKAPLNKIVKNNSFTLIFPSDYCTRGGKLAAGPCACFFLWRCYIFIGARRLRSLLLVFSVHPSLASKFFVSCLLIRHLSVWQARWTLHGRWGRWHFIGSVLEATCG